MALEPMPVIVKRRVEKLFLMASEMVKENEPRAIRYVQLARKLAARHRLPLGRGRKHLFCKKCSRPWVVGHNVKVRLRPKTTRVEYLCLGCGASRFFAYAPKAKRLD